MIRTARPQTGAPRPLACAVLVLSIVSAGPASGEGPDSKPQDGKLSLTELMPSLTPVSDYTGDFWNRYTLLGDIGGRRQQLYDRGVAFDATFTQVYQGIVSAAGTKMRTSTTACSSTGWRSIPASSGCGRAGSSWPTPTAASETP